jgi:hypothetical protein
MEFRIEDASGGGMKGKKEFLQEPHGITSQKTPFFIVTAVKTSNLTLVQFFFENISCCLSSHCRATL